MAEDAVGKMPAATALNAAIQRHLTLNTENAAKYCKHRKITAITETPKSPGDR